MHEKEEVVNAEYFYIFAEFAAGPCSEVHHLNFVSLCGEDSDSGVRTRLPARPEALAGHVYLHGEGITETSNPRT